MHTPNKAITTNPIDGKQYDLMPLFRFLQEQDKSIEDLSKEIEQHCDSIVQIIAPDDALAVKETKDIHHFLVELKQVLRKIEVVGE